MKPDITFLFHQSSKNSLDGEALEKDQEKIPYKVYHRLPQIPLSSKEAEAGLLETIRARRTRNNFGSGGVTMEDLSLLLQYSCGTMAPSSDNTYMLRAQPSGGACYPLEVYPLVLRGEGSVRSGLYHYNVKMHALEVLWEKDFSSEEVNTFFSYDWVKNASVIFLMTAVFHRNQMKYGERGYRYTLIEAGHIGQNLLLLAEALKLKSCPLGGTRDEAIEKLLDIDGVHESVVYAVAVGK